MAYCTMSRCLSAVENRRQESGCRRENNNKSHDQSHDQNHWHHVFYHPRHGSIAYTHGDKKVGAHGRRYRTDNTGYAEHDAELDRIDSECADDGVKDRHYDHHRGEHIHEAPKKQAENHYDHHERNIGEIMHHEPVDEVGANLRSCEHITIDSGGREQHHDHTCGLAGIVNGFPEVCPGELFVDELSADNGINTGNNTCLGRGKDAAEDTTQNDNWAHNCSESADKSMAKALKVEPDLIVDVVLPGVSHGENHQRNAEDKARDVTAHKQLADGVAGDGGIDYHVHAGRDDRPERAGRSQQRCRECIIVSLFAH